MFRKFGLIDIRKWRFIYLLTKKIKILKVKNKQLNILEEYSLLSYQPNFFCYIQILFE
jgi:hypothetical protein